MIEVSAETLFVSGDFNQHSAARALPEGEAKVLAGVRRINLAAAEHPDSAALAVLLGWQRAARTQGRALQFEAVPQALRALAELYGVAGMLFSPAEV